MNKIHAIIFSLSLSTSFSYGAGLCEQQFSVQNPGIDLEEKAKASGYTEPVFYEGLNGIHSLIELGKNLRSRSIDPKTTHIEDLEPFIPLHIHHIQKGLIASNQLGKLTALEKFRKEAEIRMRDKQVTLYWWQLFNIRLSAFATPFYHIPPEWMFLQKYRTHNELVDYIDREVKGNRSQASAVKKTLDLFPKTIVLPTSSDLGILALNQVPKSSQRVVPVGLFNQTTLIEGEYIHPISAHLHDYDHIDIFHYGTPLFPENPEFHKKVIQKMENLPPEERKKAEVVYFILTHEFYQNERPAIGQITNPKKLLKVIQFSESDANVVSQHVFSSTQLLNTLNESGEDIYLSDFVPDTEVEILNHRYKLLLEEVVNVFSQTARTALEMN